MSAAPLTQAPQPEAGSSKHDSAGVHDSASSGNQQSGDVPPDSEDADAKAERTKQKNKRAQKKFRSAGTSEFVCGVQLLSDFL